MRFEVIEEDGEFNLQDELTFYNVNFTYLGKSKTNINDLFKTENEE